MISDTPQEVLEIQYELYRKMSPAQKIDMVFDAIHTGQALSIAGIKMQHPKANDDEVWHIWAKRHLGDELYNKIYGDKI
jgi:hypothetical protein